MAYQFAHTQTYSRKGNGNNRSVKHVIGEAVREIQYCPHVKNPRDPKVVFGVHPGNIPSLIEERINEAKARFPHLLKGKGKGIRKDQHVMEASVFSHPSLSSELETNELIKSSYKKWRADCIEWIKKDFSERGLTLVSIIEHTDEPHPHLHAYGVPECSESNPRMDAKLCHAGWSAKLSERDTRLQNKAYREAMRDWQDKHHFDVAEKHALLRFGPRRQRLPSKAYKAQQVAAQDLARKLNLSSELPNPKDVENAKADFVKLSHQIEGLRKTIKDLYKQAELEASKMMINPLEYIKENMLKDIIDENNKLKNQNELLTKRVEELSANSIYNDNEVTFKK